MSPARRVLILVLAVAALAVAAWRLPLGSLPQVIVDLGLLGPVAGVAVGAALLVALVPRTPISLACGLLFGAGLGAACALVLAVIAAVVTFAAGRWLGRDFLARHTGRRWAGIEKWITREGVLAVAAVRAVPLGPYGLVGYAYGASAVPFRTYAAGTVISAAPSAVTYALLGAAVANADSANPLTLAPLAFGIALTAAVIVRSRRNGRRDPLALDPAS